MGEDVVVDGAGPDHTGPTDGTGHAVAAFPILVLLAAERRGAAVGPRKFFGAVIGGIHHDRVFVETELMELVEDLTNHPVVLDHAVGIDAEACLALTLFLKMREDVHSG